MDNPKTIQTLKELTAIVQTIALRAASAAVKAQSAEAKTWMKLGYSEFKDVISPDDFVKYFHIIYNEIAAIGVKDFELDAYDLFGPYVFRVRPKPKHITTVKKNKKGGQKMKRFTITITDTDVYLNDNLCECAMPMDKENREDDLNKRAILALANAMGYEATFLFEEMAKRLNEMLEELDKE